MLTPVLEIGGTHVTAALVDRDSGAVAFQLRHDLDSSGAAEAILDAVAAAGTALETDLRHWGVAIPGPFDYDTGIGQFEHVGKFDSLRGVDVGAGLTERLAAASITFVNDADAFGIGEAVAGAAAGHRRAVCITLGTGIGSAFIADGQPVNDGPEVPPLGSVHLLQWDGQDLEDTVSRRAIRRLYAELAGQTKDVHEIAALARSGDATANQVFTTCFSALGSALAPWVQSFRATALVLGGSIARSFDLVEPPLQDGLHAVVHDLQVTARLSADVEHSALLGTARAVGHRP